MSPSQRSVGRGVKLTHQKTVRDVAANVSNCHTKTNGATSRRSRRGAQMLADTERARDALAERVADAADAIHLSLFGGLSRAFGEVHGRRGLEMTCRVRISSLTH